MHSSIYTASGDSCSGGLEMRLLRRVMMAILTKMFLEYW